MANGIREFARSSPHRVAAVEGDRSLTFAAMDDRSNRLAQGVLALGCGADKPVAVLSGNRLEYFEIMTAMAKAGVPVVPLNSRNNSADNDYIVAHSGARVLILDPRLADNASTLIDTLDGVISFGGGDAGRDYEDFLAAQRAVDPKAQVGDDDTFCITYTSGTTGRPKGVVLTHKGRLLTAYGAAIEYGLGPGRQTMAVAPLYHGAGFSFGFAGPQLGGQVTVQSKWDPQEFLALLQSSRTSTVFLVPTHAQQIRRIVEEPASAYDLSALETLYFNAAALPVELKEWVHQAFPGVGIHELYGSTECSLVTDLRPEDSMRKAGSVGHPWFMNEVKLLDDDRNPVGPGEPGELWARSPMLMKGYLNNPEATAEATDADGFITVGDVAVADEEGFISIVDRKKDMIIAGGVNIFPREIEEVIGRHDSVDEVAVVGVPDETYGERIAAFVVPKAGAQVDAAALEQHVLGAVAKYKLPREWHTMDALPRNAGGKVLKRVIQDDYVASRPSAH
ncbi:long-chain fatty acid--CoA ligase [Nocardioides jishulii]|uniref:Long-chain fatty acid--CoA ligase n=2 Tax=Nocardioides jishulii TaxID=2575440 RepID=A0A4U2YNE5_9ACTN|nr:long-chain fatty acid--CoA ligase [Nocardioides jishulii]TKI62817.1 long-chain fatty acid--CoA ligase [Nocardioides jishulii]